MKLPKLPELKPRERLLATGSGLVLCAVLLDQLVLSPWLQSARNVREESQRVEHALETHARLLERKDTVLAAYERYRRYIRPPIANDLQMAMLLREVEDLAQASQVVVGQIKPSAVEETDLEKRYSLDVQFVCTMEQWVGFIHRVESSTSLYEVTRASLSRQEDVPSQLDGFLRLVSATPQSSGVTLPPTPGTGDVVAAE